MEFLEKITPREYQYKIFQTCKEKNCLVVLPTGLGKTLIALMLTINRLKKYPEEKILFLAPTKPLTEQHYSYFKKYLPELFAGTEIFTGTVPAKQRKKLWQKADIIFSTPQCISNDLKNKLYDLKEVSLLIEDEAHRCIKNYAYNYVAQQYKHQAKNQRIIGLTASPGNDYAKINNICKNLSIEAVELKTRKSPDVKKYLQELEFEKINVKLPSEFTEIQVTLKELFNKYISELKKRKLLWAPPSKTELIKLQKKLAKNISMGGKNYNTLLGMSACAQAIKIQHALELLETQTLTSFNKYIKNLFKRAAKKESKGIIRLVSKPEFNFVYMKSNELLEKNKEHPKLKELVSLIEKEKSKNSEPKIIIFAQYRETIQLISKKINELPGLKAKVFVGQTKKSTSSGVSGLSQDEQKKIIKEFAEKKINVLCSTSVHPKEYIIIKKGDKIDLRKIGMFVDSFLEKNEFSKRICGYETLTTDGKKIYFAPITHIHKHLSKLNCSQVRLSSGLDTLITEDHSLFSFDKKNKFTPSIPKLNKFVALSLNCPNIENKAEIDIFKEIKNKNISNLFGSIEGLNQAKMRKLETDLKILKTIKQKKKSITEIKKSSKKAYSTVINCGNRLKEKSYLIKRKEKKNFKTSFLITKRGTEYLAFLEWFFKNVYYRKGKYRFKLKKIPKKDFSKFFKSHLNVNYGKVRSPRKITVNKEVAKFLGFYVSEGHARKTEKKSEIFLAARKKKMQDLMEKSIREGLKLKTRRSKNGVAIDAQIGYYLIKDVFRAGIGSYNKEVPEIIFTSPSKVKWAFLETYFLGDGYFSKDKIVLTTVSRKLITGIVLLLRMLGIQQITLHKQKNIYKLNIFESLPFAKIKRKKEKRRRSYFSLIPKALKSKRIFEIYESYFNYNKNISKKCREIGKWDNDICYDFIKKIKKLKKQPKFVYDISVKKTQNFLGGTGLFVLHNSIGEEGLDIPEVNTVIFYEPIPSAIRAIQRAGRTARLKKGKLVILITEKTRDEINFYVSRAKEKKMKSAIKNIKKNLGSKKDFQKKLK